MATSFYSRYPSSGGASSNPANGTTGQTAPTVATEVGGVGPDGNLHAFSTDNAGVQNVNVTSSTLPAGGATAANQVLEIADLDSINTKTPALGQALAAGSTPVVLTAAQISALTPPTTVTVIQPTGTNLHTTVDNFPATQPVSGTVAVSNFPATQPVSAVALPLPANAAQETGGNLATIATQTNVGTNGASTSALQTSGNASLTTIATNSGTQATAANQTTANASLATIATNTTNAGTPVVSGSVKIQGTGFSAAPFYNVYSSTNITTSAYVTLVASTTTVTNAIHIFDSSGQAMILAVGGVGSEVDQYLVGPGGDDFDLTIPSGSRVSYKAKTATASSGYLLMNLLA